MAINWQDVITTFGGDVALLTTAAWLIRVVVSDRLRRDAEAFKVQVKADADLEIERMKAFLKRALHVHERQVETLTKLYRYFYEAREYLQRMAATVRLNGEVSVEEYGRLCREAIVSARDELSQNRLLIPPELAHQCDGFFGTLFEGQSHLALARRPMVVDGRNEFWDKAKQTAYEEVPRLLEQIEKAARSVIHVEQP